MKIELAGQKIKIVNTSLSDINKIMEFEKSNRQFVHSYSKQKHLALLEDNDCLHLSARNFDNDKLVGHIILFGLENQNKVLEFRRITMDDKGHGYGREAIQLLKKLCFEEIKFHRLWFDVYDDNKRAIGLYESEGFVKEGVLRENIQTKNGYRSQRIYSMLEDEYKNET